jgi:hypothetical protein
MIPGPSKLKRAVRYASSSKPRLICELPILDSKVLLDILLKLIQRASI